MTAPTADEARAALARMNAALINHEMRGIEGARQDTRDEATLRAHIEHAERMRVALEKIEPN